MPARQKAGLSRRQFLVTTGKAVVAVAAYKWMCGEACAAALPNACVGAVCGIYCGACSALMKSVASDIKCLGCRSTQKPPSYAPQCAVRQCAATKQVQSCGLCKDYPCEKIKAFFTDQPKYGLREKNLNTIRDKGLPAWLQEQKARWACQNCKTPFGYGARDCQNCGEKIYSDAEEFEAFRKQKDEKAGG